MRLEFDGCARRLRCGDGEKQACLETVRLLARACCTVLERGILALEDLRPQMAENGGAFFTVCLDSLLDGCTGEELGELCEKLLAAGDYRSGDFLRNVVIADGMRVVSRAGETGADPLCRAVAPWFGAQWYGRVAETIRAEKKRFFSTEGA